MSRKQLYAAAFVVAVVASLLAAKLAVGSSFSGGGSSGGVLGTIRMYNSANQSIANATVTAIDWDTEVYKTGSLTHSNTTNKSRIVAAAAGTITVTATIWWDTTALTNERRIGIRKNGGSPFGLLQVLPLSADFCPVSTSLVYAASVNDYFEVTGYQNTTGSLNAVGTAESVTAVSAVLVQ